MTCIFLVSGKSVNSKPKSSSLLLNSTYLYIASLIISLILYASTLFS